MLDEDSGQYVAYCPALEVSSYGDTEEEAQAAFDDALAIFIKDTTERGTLDQLLLALGWRLLKQPEPLYEPPRLPLALLNVELHLLADHGRTLRAYPWRYLTSPPRGGAS